jgi:hypothetical protein
MPLVASALAEQIKIALNQATQPTSPETIGMAEAIIEEITSMATVSFLPGGVTGDAPPSGGPLANGAASNGTIAGTTGTSLANKLKSKMNKPSITSQLQNMASAISSCINAGKVNFSVGQVTGLCTNTPLNPGTFTGGATGGLISGLDSGKLADDLANPYGSKSPEVIAFASAIATYIMGNAMVSFASPLMTGTASAGGGPILLGTGSGGTIS